MTYTSPILSLRGTCRYILNMFSHSEHGRNLLKFNGFHVNNSCFTCYPIENKKFYRIEGGVSGKRHFIMDEKYWASYTALQKPMTKSTHTPIHRRIKTLLANLPADKLPILQIGSKPNPLNSQSLPQTLQFPKSATKCNNLANFFQVQA